MAINAAGFTVMGTGSAAKSTPFTQALTSGALKTPLPTGGTIQKRTSGGTPVRTSSGGGGGGGGGGTTATRSLSSYVDPYAKWGGYAAYKQLVDDYTKYKGTAYSSITDNENNSANKYHSSILDFLEGQKRGQTKLDRQQVQNELSKSQGAHSILDMVGHGIRSGGVTLANGNAGTSSATDALARAWGDIGTREMNTVNNQYALSGDQLNADQGDFDSQNQTSTRHLNESKGEIVNSIINDAVTKLADLNSRAANASLPDRVDIEAEKNRIRTEAMTKLQAFDAELANQAKKMDNMTAKGQAAGLEHAGVAADNPFKFTTETPVQFQNTGPFASELPVFGVPKKDENK